MQLTPQDKLTLCCIKLHPSNEELEQVNSLIPFVQDWGSLINNLIDRGIGPLFLNKLPQLSNSHLIPSEQKSKLQQAYYKTVGRSTILYEHFRKIAEAFALKNIPVIVLKGIYLSEWLYQDIGLRQFSDIDLLVKEEDGLKCLSILQELGFQPYDSGETEFVKSKKEIIHYSPMILEGVSIEIHIKLHPKSDKYKLKIDEFHKNAIPVTLNNTAILALNNQDLLIHLCVHLDKHFRTGHVQFTCFNDITNLLEKVTDNFNWDDFIRVCGIHQCEDVVFFYIVLVNKFMNATVPEHIMAHYGYLLAEADEILFVKYLNGHVGSFSAVPVHLGNLKQLSSFSDKFRYSWELIFPPKDFMIQKYRINDKRSVMSDKHKPVLRLPWWFWYPYRWWVGLKGLLKVISGK